MGKIIADIIVNRIRIIDDNKAFRDTLQETVIDSDFEAISQTETVINVDQFLINDILPGDAVVSDHHLMVKNYFPINGAEVVYKCFEKHIPSVLVTRFQDSKSEIRKYRSNIPVILNPEEFEPETLIESLEICINEFKGILRPERKMWRALVRIEDVQDHTVYILIPGWDANRGISLNRSDFPPLLRNKIAQGKRFHAKTNIGTESGDDLYFTDWENK